jgi:hypothetical protein
MMSCWSPSDLAPKEESSGTIILSTPLLVKMCDSIACHRLYDEAMDGQGFLAPEMHEEHLHRATLASPRATLRMTACLGQLGWM